MIKASSKQEVIDYLTETLSVFKQIDSLLVLRNKTTKIKAIASIILLLRARIEASIAYIKNGGYELFPITMQKSIYDPIVEYLVGELQ